jgi:hypothetical protein
MKFTEEIMYLKGVVFVAPKPECRHRTSDIGRDQRKHIAGLTVPGKNLLRFLGLFLLLLSSLQGMAQATDGAITGVISDNSGAILSGANVTARNVDTGVIRTVSTDSAGGYRIAALPPGNYVLKAARDGFSGAEVTNITLTVGLEYRRDIALKIGEISQFVTVEAQQVITEPASSQASTSLISQAQIDTLPIAGRQTTQLALLTPGTNSDGTRATRPDTLVGAGDINTASTNYLVDGLTNMISGNGDPRDNVPQATVQEFKVIASQTPAEYGGRAGGVVTLVTKSGTNQIHGEAFEFYRSHYINRVDYYTRLVHDQNPTVNPIQPFLRNQYGGAVGGPILKDRLHYFGSYEHADDQEYFTVAPGVGSNGVQNASVAAAYAPLEGSFRGGGSVQSTYFGRLDLHANDKHSLFIKFFEQSPNVFYNTQTSCTTGGNNAAYSCGDQGVQGWSWAIGHTWIISPRILNRFTAQVAQSFQTNQSSRFDTVSPAVLAKLATIGTGIPLADTQGTAIFNFPNMKWGWYPSTQFHAFYQEAIEALTFSLHNHTWKVGVTALNQPRNTSASASPLGSYTFTTDFVPTAAHPTFNPNDPNFDWSSLAASSGGAKSFTASSPTIPFQDQNLTFAAYVQDEWKVRHNLTLNYGLRYDVQGGVWRNSLHASLYPAPGLPPFVHFGGHGDKNNFAPRLGVAWDVSGDGRTVVRGGFGIVYSQNLDNAFEGEVTTLRQTSIQITNPVYLNPLNGKSFSSYASTQPPNISVNADNIKNPAVYTSSFGVSRQAGSELAVHVGGTYSHFAQLPISEQVNDPANPATNSVRPLPAWGQISQSTPIGAFDYRAVYVRLEKRYSHHYQYLVSYTLGKQTAISGVTDFYHPSLDRGDASVDRRNMLVASASTRLWRGITVGGIYTLRSSLPLLALTGSPTTADGTFLNRNNSSSYYIPTTNGIPGVTKNVHSRGPLLASVNAWRASFNAAKAIVANPNPYPAIAASQIQSTKYNQLDARIMKEFSFGDRYKLQAIGQLFNVFGTDNFGGPGISQVSNALSATFGEIPAALPRQQGELAVRFTF